MKIISRNGNQINAKFIFLNEGKEYGGWGSGDPYPDFEQDREWVVKLMVKRFQEVNEKEHFSSLFLQIWVKLISLNPEEKGWKKLSQEELDQISFIKNFRRETSVVQRYLDALLMMFEELKNKAGELQLELVEEVLIQRAEDNQQAIEEVIGSDDDKYLKKISVHAENNLARLADYYDRILQKKHVTEASSLADYTIWRISMVANI